MAYIKFAPESEFPVSAEKLSSIEELVRALGAGREQFIERITRDQESITNIDAFVEALRGLKPGESAPQELLAKGKALFHELSQAFPTDDDANTESALYFAHQCCSFLMGDELTMWSGDVYKGGVLVSTFEETCEATRREMVAREAGPAMPNWRQQYQTIDEVQERTELLDAIAAEAIANWGFPGKVFQAFGIDRSDGQALRNIDDADHYASDVRACWALVVDACATKKRQYSESRLRETRSTVLASIGRC